MDFVKHRSTVFTIKEKYHHGFQVSRIYYDKIYSKLEEIRSDLLTLNSIFTWLTIRRNGDEKYEKLLTLVDDLEGYLEATEGAVEERIEYLEAVKESLEDESDDEYFERNFCSPLTDDDESNTQ